MYIPVPDEADCNSEDGSTSGRGRVVVTIPPVYDITHYGDNYVSDSGIN